MAGILRVSEASTLALHTMAVLAGEPDGQLSVRRIAAALEASDHHLAKVLQRLTHAGLVRSTRGPHGGFALARPAAKITLLAVHEAVEGPLPATHCLLGRPRCQGACMLGDLLCAVGKLVHDRLANTSLADLAGTLRAPALERTT